MDSKEDLWTQALAFYQKKDYDSALECFSAIIDLGNPSNNVLFNRALTYYNLGLLKRARHDLLAIHRTGHAKPTAYELLQRIATEQDNEAEAEHWAALAKKSSAPPTDGSVVPVSNETKVDEDGKITAVSFFKSDITFKDVVGMKDAKRYLYKHVILALRRPELFRKYGKKMGDGLLMYGATGTGKTFLVKALAGEAKANFVIVRISEIMSKYVGQSEGNVATIFKFARQRAPCIIFFDEFDALGSKRASFGDTKGEGSALRMVINSLLTELDGIEKNPEGIFVIAGTNRSWDIDSAFQRAGRFSETLYIKPPTFMERRALFKAYLKGKPIARIDYTSLALLTAAYSQAEIARICDISLLEPIVYEEEHKRERRLTTKDIIRTIKRDLPESSLKNWFVTARAEVIGKTEVQVVDNKVHTSFKSGSLEPEERVRYKALVQDVRRQNAPFTQLLISIQHAIPRLWYPT
jgi:transitional endoplasmic reticulum ATPase